MKALLSFLYALCFLVILSLLAGLFLPDTYTFENQQTVRSGSSLVYPMVRHLEQWPLWMDGILDDSATYEVNREGNPKSLNWQSKKQGQGTVEIIASDTGQVQGIMSVSPGGQATFSLRMREEGATCTLYWKQEYQSVGYLERYYLFLFGKSVARSIRGGLEKLGEQCELLRLSRCNEPTLETHSPMLLMGLFDSVPRQELLPAIQSNFQRLATYMQRRTLAVPDDSLVVFYNSPDSEYAIFACAYPIEKRTWGWEQYRCISMDTTRVATISHWGVYSSSEPFLKLHEFLNIRNLRADSLYWEKYPVFPRSEPDTMRWQKVVFVPVH